DRYEPGLGTTTQDFVNHYGTAMLPARPRKPQDKAKVEVGVQIEPPRVCRRPPSLALRRASGERQVPIVDFLCFCRRHVPKRAE
ncbi:hypothetical protein EHZ19_32490, partial [Paraburkholderia bannensis]